MEIYILTQVKRTNGTIEKGAVVKDTLNSVLQSYRAYLGAYGYGKDTNTDYVLCEIQDALRNRIAFAQWDNIPTPEPEA